MKKWEILHIPDKIPFKPYEQPTIDVFTSVIEPKLSNTLVRKLNKVAPMENHRHIKRVWKKKSVEGGDFQLILILCLVGENRNELENIPDDVLELINAHQLNPFITKVHKYAAISKEEWSEQCKLWPTSYHPPTYNIEGITGFNEDAQSIFHFMKMALELAKVGHCTDEVVNAAVTVDPSTRHVIAIVSCCVTNDQTCQSSTSTVNSTIFECGSVEQNSIATSHQSDMDAVAIKETLFSKLPWTEQNYIAGNAYSWHPLQHAAVVAIEHASSRDMCLFSGSVYRLQEDKSLNHHYAVFRVLLPEESLET
ncbi:hypothetical protein MKX01_009980 [Papaver californicum]|nr:hypothetical protein MKX01_009980 [Papaver californicum]